MLADPVLDALRRTRSPFAWSDVIDYDRLDRAGRQVMGHAAEYGMENGFVIPISGAGRTAGLVSLAGPRQKLSSENRAALTLVSLYVHQRLVALRRQEPRSSITLTDRELEIMRWIVEGKFDWQIGQILKISSKTVNYHVENVKRKFGVASRIQAVVATLKEGRLSH